jgi:DNA polymerase-3 subunit epsilon
MAARPSYAIVDKGVSGNDQSCILVLNGKLYGMGYLPSDVQVTDIEMLKSHLQPYKENSFIRNLIEGYTARYPSKIKTLKNSIVNQATESFHQQAFD